MALPAQGERPTEGRYAGMPASEIIKEMRRSGWTQEGVDTVYAMRGLGTPPTVPASLLNTPVINTRGGPRLSNGGSPDAASRDWLNSFNAQAVDPFRSYDVGNWLGVAGMLVGAAGAGGAFQGAGAGGAGAGAGGLNGTGAYGTSGSLFGTGSNMSTVGLGSQGSLAASGAIGGGAGVGGTSGALGGGSLLGGSGGNMSWMDWVGPAINAGASLIGGKKANDATTAASREAIAEQRRQFDTVRADTASQRAIGESAINRLALLNGYGGNAPDLSQFTASPDYAFNLAEGQKAIDRSAAARGGLLSGGAVREGQRYASGLASREYGAFVDRLMQQAGLGSTGIGASAAAGANSANNISQIGMNAGNARASTYMNTAANVNNAFQSGYQNMLLRRYLGES